MKKTTVFGLGLAASKVFYAFGNSVNFSNYIESQRKNFHVIIDEKEALEHDWIAIGKGVEDAFARFEREHNLEQPGRTTGYYVGTR